MKIEPNAISTIKRIQDRILIVLKAKPLKLKELKQATRADPNTKPEPKEDWDAQFNLAVLGLGTRQKIHRLNLSLIHI